MKRLLVCLIVIAAILSLTVPAMAEGRNDYEYKSEKTSTGYRGSCRFKSEKEPIYTWVYDNTSKTVTFYGGNVVCAEYIEDEVVYNAKKIEIAKDTGVGMMAFNDGWKKDGSLYEEVEEVTVLGTNYIGDLAFAVMPKLRKVTIRPSEDVRIEDEDDEDPYSLYYNAFKLGEKAFMNCKELTEVELPDDTDTLYPHVFGGCEKLKTIKLPSHLRRLSASAFQLTGITSLTIPETVRTFNAGFYYADNLSEINVDPKNKFFTSINGTMYNKDQTVLLAAPATKPIVDMPKTVKTVRQGAVCSSQKTLTIPEGITTLELGAIVSTRTEVINLPASLTMMDALSIQMHRVSYETPISLKRINYAGKKEQWDKIQVTPAYEDARNYFEVLPLEDVDIYMADGTVIKNEKGPTDPAEDPNHGDTCPSRNLSDMANTESKWFHRGVDYALYKGYMAGVGNNRFNPNGIVTRATIAQILYAAEGKPARSSDSKFGDVKSGTWYFDAVNWAAEKGLVAGYGNGKFGPDNPVTREQMVAIMYQYTKMNGYDMTATVKLSDYPDQNKISKYAVTPVRWALTHQVISGTNKGIEPKGTATRAQIAVILKAYDENIRK